MAAIIDTTPLDIEREEEITRLDTHQIIQHAVLMMSFTLLVLTGFPLKFHDRALSQWWVAVWGGIEAVRVVHRFAAWMLVAVCAYHLLYIAYSTVVLRRCFPTAMFLRARDIINFFQEIGYYLGLRKELPGFDRFNWREKVEYWAIVWGMTVMGVSGFILMYPVQATNFLPGWVVPSALVAHSFEAMMALVWIVLVHIFFSHLTPGVFPLNKSIFTGKVSRRRYQREHPLEYNRIMGIEEPGKDETGSSEDGAGEEQRGEEEGHEAAP